MKETEKTIGAVNELLSDTEKMDRRKFISTTGKVIIPTLGIMGLSLKYSGTVQAAGCKGCDGVCGGCDGTCKGGCEGFMWGKAK